MCNSNFVDTDFNCIGRKYLMKIDELSQKEMYINSNIDCLYLYDKYKKEHYNTKEINLYCSTIYYSLCNCIIHKLYVLGLTNEKSKILLDIFDEINELEKIKENPLVYIFEGLINFTNNYVIGIEYISKGVNLIKSTFLNIFLSSEFLYGANIITKNIPNKFQDIILINNNNNENDDIIDSSNIEILLNNTNGSEFFFINFTVDVIYFLAFSSDAMEILKKQENINKFGIYWNIIIDKNTYNNKQKMEEFILKVNNLFEIYKQITTIIISQQVFNEIEICDKSLFTTYRFVNMSKYFSILKKPIIQSDVDFEDINCDLFNNLFNKIKEYDIVLFKTYGTPWRKIAAGLSFFNDSEMINKFTKTFNVFLKFFFNKKKDSNWFIDQLCLTFTYIYLFNNLAAEKNIGTMYKYSKNSFHYSSQYKLKTINSYLELSSR